MKKTCDETSKIGWDNGEYSFILSWESIINHESTEHEHTIPERNFTNFRWGNPFLWEQIDCHESMIDRKNYGSELRDRMRWEDLLSGLFSTRVQLNCCRKMMTRQIRHLTLKFPPFQYYRPCCLGLAGVSMRVRYKLWCTFLQYHHHPWLPEGRSTCINSLPRYSLIIIGIADDGNHNWEPLVAS